MEKRSASEKHIKAPKTIVITGAESTGKSTLTEELAIHYQVPYIPELARNYIENLNRSYNYNDVQNIAKLQIEEFKKYKNTKSPYIFVDTWLIVTKIWFEVVFKKEPNWLKSEIESTKIDLFLVCDIDLPWIPDSVRENGGEMRKVLQEKYIETIIKHNFYYKIVAGQEEKRLKNAIDFINELQ